MARHELRGAVLKPPAREAETKSFGQYPAPRLSRKFGTAPFALNVPECFQSAQVVNSGFAGSALLKKSPIVLCWLLALTAAAMSSTASQREYKRGLADCLAGRWDEKQHGASYKEGCAATEAKRNKSESAPVGSGAASEGVAPTPDQKADNFMDPGVSSKDKQACMRAVRKQTKNATLSVIGALSSEANNQVTVAVGPQLAPWKCLVKRGKVSTVMSLTDEGAL